MKLSKSEISKRWQKIRNILISEKLDGILVSLKANLFYLSNFQTVSYDEREAFLLFEKDKLKLITSLMYQSQFSDIYPGIEIITDQKGIYEILGKLISDKNIGIEDQDLKVIEYQYLTKKASSLVNLEKKLNTLRSIKDPKEIALIKKAENISQKALEYTLAKIKPGLTEKQIAKIFAYKIEKLGADEMGFPTIVASGANSGAPHHSTGNRVIQNVDIVLIDCGAKKGGYSGDITRTMILGDSNENYKRIYNQVLKAHDLALSAIKAKVKIGNIDMVVRNFFKDKGVLDHYIHTTGHGLGIALHEYPSVSYKTEGILEEGMVITIEPGLYYDWGGVRVEDVVVVTRDGYEKISDFKVNS